MSKHVKGFVDFVREQGVVGLAVGLAIGIAAGAAVKSIVDGFINPLVGFVLGGTALDQKTWTVGHVTHNGVALTFHWGSIASSLITLTATVLVVYYGVKVLGLERLDKEKDEKK